MDFIDKTVSDVEPVKPPPVESTSFKLVQDVKDLKELAVKLRNANEFAVNAWIFYCIILDIRRCLFICCLLMLSFGVV